MNIQYAIEYDIIYYAFYCSLASVSIPMLDLTFVFVWTSQPGLYNTSGHCVVCVHSTCTTCTHMVQVVQLFTYMYMYMVSAMAFSWGQHTTHVCTVSPWILLSLHTRSLNLGIFYLVRVHFQCLYNKGVSLCVFRCKARETEQRMLSHGTSIASTTILNWHLLSPSTANLKHMAVLAWRYVWTCLYWHITHNTHAYTCTCIHYIQCMYMYTCICALITELRCVCCVLHVRTCICVHV
jgi:hypothetical protein